MQRRTFVFATGALCGVLAALAAACVPGVSRLEPG